jgi:hypothetical protein
LTGFRGVLFTQGVKTEQAVLFIQYYHDQKTNMWKLIKKGHFINALPYIYYVHNRILKNLFHLGKK